MKTRSEKVGTSLATPALAIKPYAPALKGKKVLSVTALSSGGTNSVSLSMATLKSLPSLECRHGLWKIFSKILASYRLTLLAGYCIL